MTSYFDEKERDLHQLEQRHAAEGVNVALERDVEAWEMGLVRDCDVGIELSAAEGTLDLAEIQGALDRAVISHGIVTRPISMEPLSGLDTPGHVFRRLFKLCWDLHTVFHDLGNMTDAAGDFPFSDKPLSRPS